MGGTDVLVFDSDQVPPSPASQIWGIRTTPCVYSGGFFSASYSYFIAVEITKSGAGGTQFFNWFKCVKKQACIAERQPRLPCLGTGTSLFTQPSPAAGTGPSDKVAVLSPRSSAGWKTLAVLHQSVPAVPSGPDSMARTIGT